MEEKHNTFDTIETAKTSSSDGDKIFLYTEKLNYLNVLAIGITSDSFILIHIF